MISLVVMIPLSILLVIGAGIAFFWAVDHDQFDDLDTPGLLPMLDDPDSSAMFTESCETLSVVPDVEPQETPP